MEFKDFKQLHQKHLEKMLKEAKTLFVVDVDPDTLWDSYLNSFPPGTNEVYRERREYDCSNCRHFIKQFAKVVAITPDYKLMTAWDFNAKDPTFQAVVNAMAKLVKSAPVVEVFVTTSANVGTDVSHELQEDGNVTTWHHFFVKLPKKHVLSSNDTIGTIMSNKRASKEVFQRSLEEITPDAVETILELIASNTLYRGAEWQASLMEFKKLQKAYNKLPQNLRNNFCWLKSTETGVAITRIRNHSIGTLLTNVSEGMDLDTAVSKYEAIVAPTNYKRPKAIFTEKMRQEALKTVIDLGYGESMGRRHATLNDITVNNVLFVNRDAKKRLVSDPFDLLKADVTTKPKAFDRVQAISISDFIENVLPTAQALELYVENRHSGNFVSLIAPQHPSAKSMLKWNNNFSWAYINNITDSMKERVKAAGGNVSGIIRFSLQWNEDGQDKNDLDAHCIEPNGNEIFFGNKVSRTSGVLDVDIINPRGVAVENITWSNTARMGNGQYHFFVHNYTYRGGNGGFRAELEYGGKIWSYDYNQTIRANQGVTVAKVNFNPTTGDFKIIESLPSNTTRKEVWNVKTQDFVPVTAMMYSPNYWDEQTGIGNRHYFFMLDGCKTNDKLNGFFNEFLDGNLMKHKHVFEALGSKMAVPQSDEQLSGVGFSSTKSNDVVVKVIGKTERIMKIQF